MVNIVIFRYAIAIYEHKHLPWCDSYGSIYPNPNTLNKLLVDAVNDNNLEQLINETTHGNHILDLLFCSLSQMFKSHLESWTMMLSSFN